MQGTTLSIPAGARSSSDSSASRSEVCGAFEDGFSTTGVADGDSRAQLVSHQVQRVIKRCDGADDAYRKPPDDRRPVRPTAWTTSSGSTTPSILLASSAAVANVNMARSASAGRTRGFPGLRRDQRGKILPFFRAPRAIPVEDRPHARYAGEVLREAGNAASADRDRLFDVAQTPAWQTSPNALSPNGLNTCPFLFVWRHSPSEQQGFHGIPPRPFRAEQSLTVSRPIVLRHDCPRSTSSAP